MPLIPQETPESPAKAAARAISKIHDDVLESNARQAQIAYDLFWRNPAASAAEICEEFGANGTEAFVAHAAMVAFLVGRDPALVPEECRGVPADKQYAINPDGSVTISDKPPAE